MTCLFCKYEFCWSCGASATNAEKHFEAGRGCGVKMMDENVKPGDHLRIQEEEEKNCCKACWRGRACPRLCSALKFIPLFLFFPLIALFKFEYYMLSDICKSNEPCPAKVVLTPILFIVGLFMTVVATILFYLYCILMLIRGILYVLCCCCLCKNDQSPRNDADLAEENRARARATIEE